MSSNSASPTTQTSVWSLEFERGPEWLFVKLCCQPSLKHTLPPESMSAAIWEAMRQHFVSRVLIEIDQLKLLPQNIVDEMIDLNEKVAAQGGILRFAGHSEAFEHEMETQHFGLNLYPTPETAVMGDFGRRPK